MKLLIILLLIIVAGVIALKVAAGIVGPNHELGSDTKGLSPCPDSPNCVCSLDTDAHQIQSLPFFKTEVWVKWIEEIGGVVELETGRYIHATFKTPLMGFIDDLELWIADDLSQTQVRSASRIGKLDFGVNRKRVEKLRAYATQ